MANEYELYLEASTRGYHAYFEDATVYIGAILFCELEPDNQHSKYAVVVKNEDDSIVGHVPAELSKIFNKFLSEYGKIEAECIGNRFNKGRGNGLELAVDYRLVGNARYLKKLFKELQEKNTESNYNWKLSTVQKCRV
ncbi:hypothetical protein ABFA07_018235 [Porites harrisoni]